MFPVLAQLGPFTLYTYSVLVNAALAAALAWLYVSAPADRKSRWLDLGLAGIAGGLIGARLLYVFVNGAYYGAHPFEALMLWRGGLAWPGAALGAVLAAGLLARRLHEPLGPVFDTLSVPLALLGLFSWGGCLAAGCAYGAEVAPGQLPAWLVSNAPDLYGLSVLRWPTQAAGMAWSLILLGLIAANRRADWPAGARGLYTLGLTALGAFFLSFVRGDPMPLAPGGFRLDVLGNAAVLVAASLAWASRVLGGRARPSLQSNHP